MRYIRKNNDTMEEAPASPFRGAGYYLANGYLAYSGTLPLSRLDIVDGAIVELEASEETAEPRVFSKLKLRDNLAALGLWDALKAAIESSEAIAERWELAQTIREGDADFVALKTQLAAQFEVVGTNLNDFLDTCLAE
jgi:hypothetical protein